MAGGSQLLILSRYDRMGASSRLRTMQYLPFFEEAGFDVRQSSLLGADYLDAKYGGGRRAAGSFRRMRARARLLREVEADVVWIEKEAFPWLPWAVERGLLPRSVPYAVDFDDAIFHRYDLHRAAPVRWLLGGKIDAIMRNAALVTAGNSYLAERAERAGARWVEIVPTVLDTVAYEPRPAFAREGPARIGWIGSPSTWQAYVVPHLAEISAVAADKGAVFRAVGSGEPDTGDARIERLPWSEDTEVALIQGMDIGIMPLDDSPWSRGKCGYKLIQYMACGVPVVASPVGVNSEIVKHGENGFLASTETEWRDALGTLLDDPELRRKMGAAGRRTAVERYSLAAQGPRVADLLGQVAAGLSDTGARREAAGAIRR